MAKILVADDEEAVRTFVARALVHHGHEVETVCDGAQALASMAEEQYDLLLTDIVMPVMDGIALALKATKEFPDLKILLMTGYAMEIDRAHNLDDLIHKIIAKPFTLTEICDIVEDALNP